MNRSVTVGLAKKLVSRQVVTSNINLKECHWYWKPPHTNPTLFGSDLSVHNLIKQQIRGVRVFTLTSKEDWLIALLLIYNEAINYSAYKVQSLLSSSSTLNNHSLSIFTQILMISVLVIENKMTVNHLQSVPQSSENWISKYNFDLSL